MDNSEYKDPFAIFHVIIKFMIFILVWNSRVISHLSQNCPKRDIGRNFQIKRFSKKKVIFEFSDLMRVSVAWVSIAPVMSVPKVREKKYNEKELEISLKIDPV